MKIKLERSTSLDNNSTPNNTTKNELLSNNTTITTTTTTTTTSNNNRDNTHININNDYDNKNNETDAKILELEKLIELKKAKLLAKGRLLKNSLVKNKLLQKTIDNIERFGSSCSEEKEQQASALKMLYDYLEDMSKSETKLDQSKLLKEIDYIKNKLGDLGELIPDFKKEHEVT